MTVLEAGAEVRRLRTAPHRLRLVGGSFPLRWWRARLVLGATLAGAMAGALLGVAQGYLAVGVAPVALLEAYGAGAGLGTSVGLVLGLAVSLGLGLLDRYVLAQRRPARPLWVRHRASG